MADKKLFWINKKGVFGGGKNQKVYGDEITVDDVGGKERLKKFIEVGKIGTVLAPVDPAKDNELERLKQENAELKENSGSDSVDCNDCKKLKKADEVLVKALGKKDKEIEKLKKSLKPDSQEVIDLLDEKDAKIKELEDLINNGGDGK